VPSDILSGAIVCHPFSAQASNLNGWNASLEKKYLRYFGEVSDFGTLLPVYSRLPGDIYVGLLDVYVASCAAHVGQSGSLNEHNLLFGLRGGASI